MSKEMMSFKLALNRKLRRLLREKFGHRIFDKKLAQILLGFNQQDGMICDNLTGFKLKYDYFSDIGSAIFFEGKFESEEINFFTQKLMAEVQPLVLDIGANIGLHSILWAKAIPNIRVFAFEPAPETRSLLIENIATNQLEKQVLVIPEAVSNQSGELPFFQARDNAFSSLKDTKRKEIVSQLTVPVTTIDEFTKSHQIFDISLIKIDVEGFETEVVQGGIETLRLFKPDLFIEIYGGQHSNPDPESTIQLLCSLNYKAFTIQSGQAIPYQKHSDLFYNYYFTQKSDLAISSN